MSQHTGNAQKPHYEVLSIAEFYQNDTPRQSCLRIGVAFKNQKDSFNLLLRALPLPDPKDGIVRLHMRLVQEEISETTDNTEHTTAMHSEKIQ